MVRMRIAICGSVSLAMVLVPTASVAEKASQLAHINGMDAAPAERELRSRGFSHESSHDSYANGYTYSYWWNKSDNDCIRVEAHSGEVVTVVDAKDGDCGHSNDGAAVAVAAVAGAAILGAILTSKSHHRTDQDEYGENRREFDRGYSDGLYHHTYHNSGNSTSYSRGYSAGVDERNGHYYDQTGRGGYSNAVSFSDLRGDRASGAMSAMQSRGFRQVDNFTSGNTRYSIQWRDASRQCVQMTISNGRIYDIRDIRTHPQCR